MTLVRCSREQSNTHCGVRIRFSVARTASHDRGLRRPRRGLRCRVARSTLASPRLRHLDRPRVAPGRVALRVIRDIRPDSEPSPLFSDRAKSLSKMNGFRPVSPRVARAEAPANRQTIEMRYAPPSDIRAAPTHAFKDCRRKPKNALFVAVQARHRHWTHCRQNWPGAV